MSLSTYDKYDKPIVAKPNQIDHSSELWGFGLLCYEVLTGQIPWKGVSCEEIPFVMNEKFFDVNPPIANLALQNFAQGCLQYEG